MKNRSVRDWDTPMGQAIMRDTPNRTNVTVTENRAPTDDSIRIVREMEQKARDNVMLAIKCDANTFKFRAVVFDDMANFRKIARISFTLGSQAHDIEAEIPLGRDSREECIKQIHDAIIRKLSEVLVIEFARENFLKL